MKVKIDVNIYSMTVVVVTTFGEYKKLHPTADKDNLFCTAEYGPHIYVLVSEEWDSMYHYLFIQSMTHELNHAAMCLLNYVGVNFDYENQEALCYLQDFLVAAFFKVAEKNIIITNRISPKGKK